MPPLHRCCNVTIRDRPTRGKIRVNHVVALLACSSASNVAAAAVTAAVTVVVGIRYNGRLGSLSPSSPSAFL